MKKLFGVLTLAALLISVNLFAQTGGDEVLLTIDGNKVTKGEFVRIYMKNNSKDQVIDQKSLEEYLELFINFKLKVSEAVSLGLDTTEAFTTELAGYRTQLAKPYLVNQEVDNQLIHEAYDRLQYDVKASHILLKLDKNAAPADTFRVYNKLMSIKKRIAKGASFNEQAKKYSEDPSAANNGGNLGYFTGFQMVYPFETAAYSTPVGEVSDPVRTRFGYHLVKVEDKRKASGKVRVAHIMVAVPENADADAITKANAKINNIYNQLLARETTFEKMARQFSDDKASAARGGELPVFGTGKMVPEFEAAAFALEKENSVSKPVKTAYGFHIIKLLEKQGIESFDEMKNELKSRIQRDSRAGKSKEALINQLKKEYHFKQNDKIAGAYHKYVTDSILIGTWDGVSAADRKDVLFTLNGVQFLENDFTEYLLSKKVKSPNSTIKAAVATAYNVWVDDQILAYEDSQLEQKYPDFRYLMNEYHDGILLFELSDRMVWTKAVKDTVGLQKYYDEHKSEFMWDKRLDLSIYTLNEKIDTVPGVVNRFVAPNAKALKKIRKVAAKRSKKGYDAEQTEALMNAVFEKYGSNYNVTIEDELFEKDDHYLIERLAWEKGISENFKENGELIFVNVNKALEPQPKALKEVKGLITADYQNSLEAQWVEELRAKYKVEVNKEVLKSIK